MKGPNQKLRIEPRWPVALTIVAVLFFLAALPGRIRLFPNWLPYIVGIVFLLPIAAVMLTKREPWLRIERMATLIFFMLGEAGTIVGLVNLIGIMINRSSEISGVQLLTSSIAVWVMNILMFSLLYWQTDRGGPEARVNNMMVRPDWLFPQTGVPSEVQPDWRPKFFDYLFLGFTAATAFSPTDVLPLTTRAKFMMMCECSISLTTIVVVASRAINILR